MIYNVFDEEDVSAVWAAVVNLALDSYIKKSDAGSMVIAAVDSLSESVSEDAAEEIFAEEVQRMKGMSR